MLNRTPSPKELAVLLLLALALAACRGSRPPVPPASTPTSGSQPAPMAPATRPSSTPTPHPVSMPSPTPPPVSPELVAGLEESTTDILGFHKTSPDYQKAIDAGLRVVNVPELGSFFALWVPDEYNQQEVRRVMAVVPGTKGVVYKTLGLRLPHARAHGYALVIVQWWLGEGDDYLPASVVYSLLAAGLEYVGAEYGADVHRAALEGFSRGSAISWEIAYWDRALGNDYFALFICHSGGMHDPGPPFIAGLRAGAWGDDVYAGQHFYMYCGMKDRQWGPAQCEYMHNAEQMVIEYGGTVERFIEDPTGDHADFLLKDDYYEDAVRAWFELTG